MNKIYWWTEKNKYKDIDFLIDLVKSKEYRFCYFEILSESKKCVISSISDRPTVEYESNTEEVLIRRFDYKTRGDNYTRAHICTDWKTYNISDIVNIKEITADEYNAF